MEHEALILLFRNRPDLAVGLLREVLGVDVPSFDEARIGSAELTEVKPSTLRADLMVELHRGGTRVAAIVVEVQLHADADKRLTWPAYVASARQQMGCPVLLLVVATDESVRRWAERPIPLGHPGLELTPLVLSPTQIPVVEDRALATRHPELAVLSSVAHARESQNFELLLTALYAVAPFDEDLRGVYTTILLNAAGEALRNQLEREMNLGHYPEPTDLEKRILARGEALGKAEGKAEGKAQALLTIAAARGLQLSEPMRQQVVACADTERLDAWLIRAATAERADEIFAEH